MIRCSRRSGFAAPVRLKLSVRYAAIPSNDRLRRRQSRTLGEETEDCLKRSVLL
jgi:hypothetical protein